jgi:predicted helicase
VLVDNSARRTRQKKLDIRVIIGNPPYSVGQKDDNDAAANIRYPGLDARLQATYVSRSTGNPRSLYDSYVRAIRWASDRVGTSGIIGFVTNAGFVDGKAADGLRKCLAEEFSSLYVFHLRGNQRTVGELSKKEGGKVFGSGSRAPVAISLFVKNPSSKERGRIHFRDIGDYLTREEKLAAVATFGSVAGIEEANGWSLITPDAHGDWVKQLDAGFERHIVFGDKRSAGSALFASYSNGVKTNRDAWAYGPSKRAVSDNMERMIAFYNDAVERKTVGDLNDSTKIGWSWVLRRRFEKGQRGSFSKTKAIVAIHRPFEKRWLYYDGFFNENRYQMPRLFPDGTEKNLVIVVKQRWSGHGQLALMVDRVVDVQSDGGTQCFPLYLYDGDGDGSESDDDGTATLFAAPKETPAGNARRDGVTDAGLAHLQDAYPGERITKEDVFYYVYGILHSADYRERYADNLGKELPRLPRSLALSGGPGSTGSWLDAGAGVEPGLGLDAGAGDEAGAGEDAGLGVEPGLESGAGDEGSASGTRFCELGGGRVVHQLVVRRGVEQRVRGVRPVVALHRVRVLFRQIFEGHH